MQLHVSLVPVEIVQDLDMAGNKNHDTDVRRLLFDSEWV